MILCWIVVVFFLSLSLWILYYMFSLLQAFEHLIALELVQPMENSGGSRVQKEYRLMSLMIHPSQVLTALQKYPNCPTEISQWASCSTAVWHNIHFITVIMAFHFIIQKEWPWKKFVFRHITFFTHVNKYQIKRGVDLLLIYVKYLQCIS